MMYEEEYTLGIGDYIAIVKRRKNLLIFPAVIIFAIAVLLAFALPSIYRSEGTILIEQQEIPPDLVRSTVTSYAGERIQIISQRVMTNENLGKIIKDYGLYKEELQKESLTSMVDVMREDISLEMVSADVVDPRSGRPTTATIAFKLAFNHQNPRQAQKVTNELISLYLNENLKQRTKSAVETSSFLRVEAEKLGDEVSKLESAMAEFKERNIDNLPELQQLNIQLMERSERDLKDIEQNIRTLEGRNIYLSSELAQLSTTSSRSLIGPGGKRFLSSEDRLKALQAEYISMSSRYSKAHPDLIKMGKEIKALKKETGYVGDVNELQQTLDDLQTKLVTLKQRYSSKHPDIKKLQRAINATNTELKTARKAGKTRKTRRTSEEANNPTYILLQAQLNAVTVELKSFKISRQAVREKIKSFEVRLLNSPQIEREYKELTRDYENATLKYREVKNKQLEAELATSLERENKGERFSLIEPPLIPEKPIKPNRPAIIFLGFVLAIGAGFGFVAVAEAMNTAIRTPQELVSITNTPPIIVIPYIETDAERAQQKGLVVKTVIVILLSGIAFVIAFHLFVMPLDVLWYVLMRKLGLSE